jgi:hypothetical protein
VTSLRQSLVLAAAFAGLCPGLALAENDVVIGAHERPPLLTLDPFSGSLGFRGFYSAQSTSTRGSSANAENLLLSEELTLATHGTIVSPKFFDWYGSGTLALQEIESSGSGTSQSEFGLFDTYDFHTNILKDTLFPVTAYATRSESFIDRAFAALLRSTDTSYGGTVRYASPELPTTLSLIHTSATQTGLSGNTEFSSETDQFSAQTAFQPFDRQHVELNYSYATNSQNNPGFLSNNFETQTAAISHDWAFDADGNYSLSQGLSYSDQTGSFPASSLYASESLRMRLAENLRATLDYHYNQQSNSSPSFVVPGGGGVPQSFGSTLTENDFTGTLSHQLFESLTSTASAGGSWTDNEFTGAHTGSSSSQTAFVSLAESYTKKLFLGRLGATAGINYTQTTNTAVTEPQQVLGDTRTFNDSQPIILTHPGTDASSIAVFDSTGTRLFVPGLDYTVHQVGNTVHVDRIVGGAIDENSTVRLNYLINPLPGYTSDTATFNIGANYLFEEGLFKGLNLYANYIQSDQTISPSSSGVLPDNLRDTLLGAQYRIWKLALTAEDQNHESTLAPYHALRFSAHYQDNLTDRTILTLDASQYFTEYPASQSHSSLTTAGGQITYQITRDVSSLALVRWRNEDDSIQGRTEGFEEQARVQWKVRQTELFFMVRHTSLESSGAKNDSFFLQFGLTRHF